MLFLDLEGIIRFICLLDYLFYFLL